MTVYQKRLSLLTQIGLEQRDHIVKAAAIELHFLNMLGTYQLNNKGQVAIFVALVFQVLFVFFAMVINIGLLVHHKINLQNSVDLAAYYAASKQAQNLNAIAHINYQMRQSWKLFTWRYRILGGIGVDDQPIGNLVDSDDRLYPYDPFFCVTSQPPFAIKLDAKPENSCRKRNQSISTLTPPTVIAPFNAINTSVRNIVFRLNVESHERCKIVGPFNFQMLAKLVFGYRQDLQSRRSLLNALANNMSQSEQDFFDIEGESVAEGAKKTLFKNLAHANREGLGDFKVYNSLAANGCASTGATDRPPQWLKEIQIYPGVQYMDTNCGAGANQFFTKQLLNQDTSKPFHGSEIQEIVDFYWPFVTSQSVETGWYDSVGFEKNPWCMAYVGVTASAQPKLPFAPINLPVTLKASAYAKPFGGRIGPWDGDSWPRGSDRSNAQTGRLDPLLPPRPDGSGQAQAAYPNYSRFPGDAAGLGSNMLLLEFAQKIYTGINSAVGLLPYDLWFQNDLMVNDPNDNRAGDIIAGADSKPDHPIRIHELSVAAPDVFDVSYYSIEPDFARTYLPQLTKFAQKHAPQIRVRGDLGWISGIEPSGTTIGHKYFGIKDQIATAMAGNSFTFDRNKFYHGVNQFANVLTSWTERSFEDYSFNIANSMGAFGRCSQSPEGDSPPTPGHCIAGGRTGYSVKLVSKSYLLSNELNIGGRNGGSGSILNQPPRDF